MTTEKENQAKADLPKSDADVASADELLQRINALRTTSWQKEVKLEGRIRQLERLIDEQESVLAAVYASKSWRITSPLRQSVAWIARQKYRAKLIVRALSPGGRAERAAIVNRFKIWAHGAPGTQSQVRTYAAWFELYQSLSDEDQALIRNDLANRPFPAVRIFWRIDTGSASDIATSIESLKAQFHPRWEAWLVVPDNMARDVSTLKLSGSDARLHLVDSGELSAVPRIGPVVVIDRPGRLVPHALYLLLDGMESEPSSSVFLSDEDQIDANGNLMNPRFVGAYSPELPTTGSIALMRHPVSGIEGNESFNIRAMVKSAIEEQGGAVTHVPFVTFHAKNAPTLAGNEDDRKLEGDGDELPFITIVIPTRDRYELMEPCVTSILAKTEYPRSRYEVVVVDNGSVEVELLVFLEKLAAAGDIRVLRDPRKFNYARLNNLAVSSTDGELVAFVNNDIVVLDPAWLRRLAFHAMKPGVGAVGGKLLYPDMTVQHGGVIVGIQGVAGHAHVGLQASEPGYLGLNNATQAISGVTGACLMMRRDRFQHVGGFNEDLAVAFNDTLLCMDAMAAGWRNIYVGHPLLIHFESKSRGFDDTPAKKALFHNEARYARAQHPTVFRSDRHYSDNLSFEVPYRLSEPPRTFKPWYRSRSLGQKGKQRILILSVTHQIGHGVPVVIDIHARHLAKEGHKVFVGGPASKNDFPYPGCERVYIESPQDAAVFATLNGVDCVIMHTPPFFSTTRWLGSKVKAVVYDHGEPPPDLFPDAEGRRAIQVEKNFCLEMADAKYANSTATRDESGHESMGVIPLGNTHLAQWSDSMVARRNAARARLGWDEEDFVVLNVCRFHAAERYYKGIDEFCAVKDAMLSIGSSAGTKRFTFALVGKGDALDVKEMESRGLRVFPNVTDEQMLDMYCCADLYANFSRWEGYNLGIGQALAMGLDVVASDIPVHRTFPIFTSSDTEECAEEINRLASLPTSGRTSRPTPWEPSLQMLSRVIDELHA